MTGIPSLLEKKAMSERAAIVVYMRKQAEEYEKDKLFLAASPIRMIADAIERGEYLK